MAHLIQAIVSDQRQRLLTRLVFLVGFLASFGLLVAVGVSMGREEMRAAARDHLAEPLRLRANADTALELAERTVRAAPCSPTFREQLRGVAFLPDGLNEFFHAPDGVVRCSTSAESFPHPMRLGRPDMEIAALGLAFWIDRPLGDLGVPGHTGTLVTRNGFGVVIPSTTSALRLRESVNGWMTVEAVLRAPDGGWWHRGGVAGVHGEAMRRAADPRWSDLLSLIATETVCSGDGHDCVSVQGAIGARLQQRLPVPAIALVFSVMVGGWLSRGTRSLLRKAAAFEARFGRLLGPSTLVCHYQPVVELASGRIVGCEALARWIDADGSTVTPDRVIPVVERRRLTLRLTELVAARAYADLSALSPGPEPLVVSINVFPCDLQAAALLPLVAPFLQRPERFRLVLEIVETQACDVEALDREIRALQAAGVRVYIDDFGAGYSSMETLVRLPVDGVKIDKAFAMAGERTVLSRMLDLAIEMVKTAGRPVVVEGVETAECLERLRSGPLAADYAQGWHISRPVPIDRFADLLAWNRDTGSDIVGRPAGIRPAA